MSVFPPEPVYKGRPITHIHPVMLTLEEKIERQSMLDQYRRDLNSYDSMLGEAVRVSFRSKAGLIQARDMFRSYYLANVVMKPECHQHAIMAMFYYYFENFANDPSLFPNLQAWEIYLTVKDRLSMAQNMNTLTMLLEIFERCATLKDYDTVLFSDTEFRGQGFFGYKAGKFYFSSYISNILSTLDFIDMVESRRIY